MAPVSHPNKPAALADYAYETHAVIEASAGTGKTFAIEHLVLDLLLNTDTAIDQILVMTFTEKATAELRSRIRALLEESFAEGFAGLDAEGKKTIGDALFAFDRAPIFTIHAFCQHVLTDSAFHAGSALTLEVVDGRMAFHRAFRAELRENFAKAPVEKELLANWLAQEKKSSLADLENLLYAAHVNGYIESGQPESNLTALAELVRGFDTKSLDQAYQRIKGPLGSRITKQAARILAETINEASNSGRDTTLAIREFDFEIFPAWKRVIEANDNLAASTRRLIDLIETARTARGLEVRITDAFLPRVAQRLEADKRNAGQLDFDDMREWVWDALEGPSGAQLAASLRARYRYALVDEFQDTDEVQWKILRRVFTDGQGSNRLCVVGDPKQAIYAFRGADVFTYLKATEDLLLAGAARIELIENHRATESTIAAVNKLLDQNASPSIFSGPIKYEHPVKWGQRISSARNNAGDAITPITIFRYGPAGARDGIARARMALGSAIAAEIHSLLTDAHKKIFVSDDGAARPLEPNDIYILTRTNSEAYEIGEYLRERGVAFAFYRPGELFQTGEASDVLDVLRAIERPGSRSRRLRAWGSPFFAVPYEQLFAGIDPPGGHPLIERLHRWKALAEEQRFAELFDLLLHESGLVNRELFLSNSERELTNYLHLFELLLESATGERLSLTQLIARLQEMMNAAPPAPGPESHQQRIESERSAVQIMTVHVSKGLQAHVVFLFGGTSRLNVIPAVNIYHDANDVRCITLGRVARDAHEKEIKRESIYEDERLLYVAMTRARSKLYLPLYLPDATKRKVDGYYERVNSRLQSLNEDFVRDRSLTKLFEVRDISRDISAAIDRAAPAERLKSWIPAGSILIDEDERRIERALDALRWKRAGMVTRSYTSLAQRAAKEVEHEEPALEEFKYPHEDPAEGGLRGGRSVGLFLHEVIEKLDLPTLSQAADLDTWKNRDEVRKLFDEAMRHHQVTEPRWLDEGAEMIFRTLTATIPLREGGSIGPICQCTSAREMEFTFPIPERTHALLGALDGGEKGWTAERGYLRGFVDMLLQDRGRFFFIDWKSDHLDSYGAQEIERHVDEHYALQAQIYSLGVVRLLSIRTQEDYERQFGGMLYVFLRGVDPARTADGIYSARPSWDEICAYETSLMSAAARPRALV